MRSCAFLVLALLTAAPALAADAAATSALKTEDQKTLYAVGVWLGGRVGPLGLKESELKFVTMGLKDSVLDAAAKEAGAAVTPSGLIFTEVQAGAGDSPKATDTIRANYEGRLSNGTVFDSSKAHGGPVEFGLDHVVPCWTEAFQKFKVGGKAKIVCPSDSGYGDVGNPGGNIPGGAALVFDVELVEIVKKAAPDMPAKPDEQPAKPNKKPTK